MENTQQFRGWYMVGAVHLLLALIFGAAYSFGAFFTVLQTNFDAGRFSTASIFSLTALIYYVIGCSRRMERPHPGAHRDQRRHPAALTGLRQQPALVFAHAVPRRVLHHGGAGRRHGLCAGGLDHPALVHRPPQFGLRPGAGRDRPGHPHGPDGRRRADAAPVTAKHHAGLCRRHRPAWPCRGRQSARKTGGTGTTSRRHPPRRGRLRESGAGRHGRHAAPGSARARFWWLFSAIFFGSIGLFLALVHINPYAQQQGLDVTQANLLIGLIGVGNIGGRRCWAGSATGWDHNASRCS